MAHSLNETARGLGLQLEVRTERHFVCSREESSHHVAGRKQLRMEFFYRKMRRRTGLMMQDGEPVGGAWNFDAENRQPCMSGIWRCLRTPSSGWDSRTRSACCSSPMAA